MKLSIITSTYNSKSTLQTAIDSIQSQSCENVEIIIIDGASTDGSIEIIKSNSGISQFISEKDKGIYDALNKGVKLATGDVIGFLHSDDLFADSYILSRIMEVFNSTSMDGVYGDLIYVDKENTDRVVRKWKSQKFNKKLLKRGWMPAHPTLFLKKEVYQKHGCFDLDFKIAGDYDFMLRILKDRSLKFEYLPKIITKMRVGGASNRSLKNIIQKSKEDYKAIKKNKIGDAPFVLLAKNLSKIPQFF